MVDTHYDLLTICYLCYLNNDYSLIEQIAENINKTNIKCIFANLYFMGIKEMKDELHINYFKSDISILQMFKVSKKILEYYLPNIDFIYSIEGCDYLSIDNLNELYNEGLRSAAIVWNNKNIYGSGNKSNKTLTKKGIKLLNKLIELGIAIDLSHANKRTFFKMIKVIKKNKRLNKKVICFASHSNSKVICNRKRNLTDRQLKVIKDVDGLVGIFSNINFVSLDKNINQNQKEFLYLEHIMHVIDILGINNVMLSTDDMSFLESYKDAPIYNYCNIYNNIKRLLSSRFDDNIVSKILYGNAYEKIIRQL